MKHNAFTLAEILITLLIIGVVAALTIPSVISNYQQQEFKTGLKKAVSVLNEAIQTNIAIDGETPYENNDLIKYLKRHMSVINTFSSPIDVSDNHFYGTNEGFYTTDGMRFEFTRNHLMNIKLHEYNVPIGTIQADYSDGISNCGSYGLLNNPNNTKYAPCIVVVDVNGDKKPNPIFSANKKYEGRIDGTYTYTQINDKKINDLFLILITDEKAIPFGVVAQRAMYSK